MAEYLKEQIEDYLRGRLSQKEHEAFEKALENDQDLQKELAYVKLTIQGAKKSGRDDLKNRLKRIQKEYEGGNKEIIETKKISLWPKWIGIAASVLLIITAGIFFLGKDELNTQRAFNEYYEAAPLRLATRDLDTEKTIVQLNEYYTNKDYNDALPYFQKLLAIDSMNARMQLGIGICYLELDQLKSARNHFLSIIKAQDFRLQHQANWYMALSYLKEGKLDDAKKYLAPIINDSKADHHTQSIELMEKLKNS